MRALIAALGLIALSALAADAQVGQIPGWPNLFKPGGGFTTFTTWTDTGSHFNSATRTTWTDYGSHLE